MSEHVTLERITLVLPGTQPELGVRIRAGRQAKGVSLRALQSATGIPASSLSGLERGMSDHHMYARTRKIADALGLDFGALWAPNRRAPTNEDGCGAPHCEDGYTPAGTCDACLGLGVDHPDAAQASVGARVDELRAWLEGLVGVVVGAEGALAALDATTARLGAAEAVCSALHDLASRVPSHLHSTP